MDDYSLFTDIETVKEWSRDLSENLHIDIKALIEKAKIYDASFHTDEMPETIDKLDHIYLVCYEALLPFFFPVRRHGYLFTALKLHVFSKVLYTAEYLSSSGSYELSRFCQTPPPWNNEEIELDSQCTRNYSNFLKTGGDTNWAHRYINYTPQKSSTGKMTFYRIGGFLPLFDWLILMLSVKPYEICFSDDEIIKGMSIKTVFEGKKKVDDIEMKYVNDYLRKGIDILLNMLESFYMIQEKSSLADIEKFLYHCRFENATAIHFVLDIIKLLAEFPDMLTIDYLNILEKMPIFFRDKLIYEIRVLIEDGYPLPENYINELKYLCCYLIPLFEELFSVLIWESAYELSEIQKQFSEYFNSVLNYERSFDFVPTKVEQLFMGKTDSSFSRKQYLEPYESGWFLCKKGLLLGECIKAFKEDSKEDFKKAVIMDTLERLFYCYADKYTLAEFLRNKYSPRTMCDGYDRTIFPHDSLTSISDKDQQIVFFKIFMDKYIFERDFLKGYDSYMNFIVSYDYNKISPFFNPLIDTYIVKTLYDSDGLNYLRRTTLAIKKNEELSDYDSDSYEAKIEKHEKEGISRVLSTDIWSYLYGYIRKPDRVNITTISRIPVKLLEAKTVLEEICTALIEQKHLFFHLSSRIHEFSRFGLLKNDRSSNSMNPSYPSCDNIDLIACDYCFTMLCNLPFDENVIGMLKRFNLDDNDNIGSF